MFSFILCELLLAAFVVVCCCFFPPFVRCLDLSICISKWCSLTHSIHMHLTFSTLGTTFALETTSNETHCVRKMSTIHQRKAAKTPPKSLKMAPNELVQTNKIIHFFLFHLSEMNGLSAMYRLHTDNHFVNNNKHLMLKFCSTK